MSAIVKGDTLLLNAFDRGIFKTSDVHRTTGTGEIAGKAISIV